MPYANSPTMPVETARVDVLDSGGDERRRHDAERLTAVALGIVSGVLTFVALAQGPWAQASHHTPPPRPLPVTSPAAPPVPGPTPHAAPPPGLPGTADAATAWLAERRLARPHSAARAHG